MGLESNGGVNAAYPRSDICGHEVIYTILVLFHKLSTVHLATSERMTEIQGVREEQIHDWEACASRGRFVRSERESAEDVVNKVLRKAVRIH